VGSPDHTKAQPDIRQVANTAVAAADDMLSTLHRLRQPFVTELRQSDEATAAGVDAMLATQRAGNGERLAGAAVLLRRGRGYGPGSWPDAASWMVQAVSRASCGVPACRPVRRTASR
jgi:hypothetical protein